MGLSHIAPARTKGFQMNKMLLAGAAALALTVAAGHASAATTLEVTHIGGNTSFTEHLFLAGKLDKEVYPTAQYLTVTGFTDPILALCFGILGNDFFGDKTPPELYTTGTTIVNGDGSALSIDERRQLNQLMQDTKTFTTLADLAGIQNAVWRVLNPGLVIDTHGNVQVDARTAFFFNDSTRSNISFTALSSVNGPDGQPLGIAVPEPSTWALMLTGFLGLGMALRRRRQTAALA
ncbi:MAG: sorting protein [Parcubacteria group bacterium]|nr:sorting protein [Parcubacteria group bacterium]